MHSAVCLLVGLLTVLFFSLIKRSRSTSNDASLLQGPESRSWIYGNMPTFTLELPGGRTVSSWVTYYGKIFKFRACFGEERLLVADPISIKHILSNTSIFRKSPDHAFVNLVLFGRGSVISVQGESHRRIRSIVNPMFSVSNVRSLTPIISNIAQNLADDWSAISGTVSDICRPLHLAALRVMLEAVMGYEINIGSEYSSVYKNLVTSIAQRSKGGIITAAILSYLPSTVTRFIKDHPPAAMKMFLDHHMLTRQISKELLERKRQASNDGVEAGSDLFSILVDTNDKAANNMTDDELHDQFGTLAIAGEDTSASALLWLFYSLSVNVKWQHALQHEITEAFAASPTGDLDYDKLPVLNAVIKEVLRLYPTVPYIERMANEDTVLPLSDAVTTTAGISVTEVTVRKGTVMVISIMDFNRLPSIWGEDATQFNPGRWLDKADIAAGPSIGPYANLLSFNGGPRVCLGWRLAILELQIFTSEIVRKFSFSLPENVTIQPATAISLVPIDGEGKTALPLKIECRD